MEPFLLISDLDNTLLGDAAALRQFCEWWSKNGRSARLVYASGRFFESIAESIKEHNLPVPDAVIGGVGSEIRLYPGGNWIDAWRQDLSCQWDARTVQASLKRLRRLELQPSEFQSPFKLSYYLPEAEHEELESVRCIAESNNGPVELVYSSRRDLDLLPAGVNKGSAAAFIAWHWQYRKRQVIVCGDSGNDLAMLRRRFRGVVVANGTEDVKHLAEPDVYVAARSYAGGVIEGLEYWLQCSSSATRESTIS
jgi:sucrose-6F-phosphate phosphohydrolase